MEAVGVGLLKFMQCYSNVMYSTQENASTVARGRLNGETRTTIKREDFKLSGLIWAWAWAWATVAKIAVPDSIFVQFLTPNFPFFVLFLKVLVIFNYPAENGNS